MARADVPDSWMTTLGILKTAGAIGLLVGIRVPVIGIAAAIGLVLFLGYSLGWLWFFFCLQWPRWRSGCTPEGLCFWRSSQHEECGKFTTD